MREGRTGKGGGRRERERERERDRIPLLSQLLIAEHDQAMAKFSRVSKKKDSEKVCDCTILLYYP